MGASVPFAFVVFLQEKFCYTISMIELKTKEDLLYLMQSGMMRLSKYDLKFIQNILTLSIKNNSITTNQVALLDKLIGKYKRQLAKQQVSHEFALQLAWSTNIVESDLQHTSAYILIENDTIIFRAPYNKKFLHMLRTEEPDNPYSWNKEERYHEAPYGTYNLKVLLRAAHNHYDVVNYCPIVTKLLNTVCHYEKDSIWDPTLVKVNDLLYVVASNDSLNKAIKDVEFETTADCYASLAEYGVNIHPSLLNDDKFLEFSSKYIVNVDFQNIDEIVRWIKLLKYDRVFISGAAGMQSRYRNTLYSKLTAEHISYVTLFVNMTPSTANGERPVLIQLSTFSDTRVDTSKFKKIIKLANSTPINIS